MVELPNTVSPNLLLVTDSEVTIRQIQQIYQTQDIKTNLSIVSSYHEIIPRVDQENITVVLLDLDHLSLNNCSEAESILLLRNHPKSLVAAPIIVLVSARNKYLGQQALQGFAQDYLVKEELDPKYTTHVLQRAIERHQLDLRPNATALPGSTSTLEDKQQGQEELTQTPAAVKLDSIRIAIFSLDSDWCFTYLNAAAEQFLQYSQAELLGVNIWSKFPVFRGTACEQELKQAKQQNCCIDFEQYCPEFQAWLRLRAYSSEDGLIVLVEDVSIRVLAENALAQRDAYFSALVEIQLGLLANPSPQTCYNAVLTQLGKVSHASRVYIFENHHDAESNLCMSRIAEWCAEGIQPQQDNPQLQNLPYEYGFSRWQDILSQGGFIVGEIQDFPASEQQLLASLDVESILILPLLVHQTFFGYIGFDHCHTPRLWQTSEIKLLSAAAAALSLSQERLQATQALSASEVRYRSVVENAQEVIFQTDMSGNWTLLNEAWTEITGWEISETIGRSMLEFIDPVDQANALKCLESLSTQTQLACTLETRYQHKTDSVRWLKAKIRPLHNTQGKVIGTSGTLDDITEQKLAQKALEQEYQHLKQIITHAPVAIAMFDTQMRFLACSGQFCRDYNLTEPILNQSLYDKIPDLPETCKMIHQEVLQGEPHYNPEYLFERADGTKLYIRSSLLPWLTATREIGGMIIVTQKINELVEARETAFATAEAKAQFLATMSHELRTPLNGIIGMAELLLKTQLDFQQHDFLRTLHSSANSLLGLINNILDFSKVEAQELELDLQEFDLRQYLEEITELLATQALSKNDDLFLFVDADVPGQLIGDAFRLRQVLLNLLGNALKFTEAGEIRLQVAVDTNSPQPQQGIRLRFEVQDTGIGIAEEDKEKLFRSFAQANASITRNYGGTGLGLMICKGLVNLMGGEIGVESQLGQGSTFWFTVTFEVAATSSETRELKPLAQHNLIVIDANATFRDLVFAYTEDWGIKTHTTNSLEEGLVCLETAYREGKPYDFAIVSLPVQAVVANQLGELLKTHPYLTQTQWIAAININQHPQISSLQEQGASHCLLKPLKPTKLREIFLESSQAVPPPTQVSRPKTQALKILVADDTPVNQKVILNQLHILGYSAEVVSDGQQALDKLEQEDYDLILVDCSMPNLDGYEVTERLRQSQLRNCQAVVIALTAHAVPEIRERCLATGMNDYLSKPVSLDELKGMLERWFPVYLFQETSQKTPVNLEQLEEFCGKDQEFQKIVLQSFCEDAPEYLRMIQESVAQADVEAVEQAAHRLRGSAATAAVYQLPELAKQLEEQASQGYLSLENTQYLLKRIEEIVSQVEGFVLSNF